MAPHRHSHSQSKEAEKHPRPACRGGCLPHRCGRHAGPAQVARGDAAAQELMADSFGAIAICRKKGPAEHQRAACISLSAAGAQMEDCG